MVKNSETIRRLLPFLCDRFVGLALKGLKDCSFSCVSTRYTCTFKCKYTHLNTCIFYFSNLDETTRSIYKENVRLNEALSYHVKAGDELLQVIVFFHV